ncbi:MAG: hypothetical protein GDA46_01610 [Bdellovibrionales bacterium]|nr:hypothetical protein [Bdellovibrionales bacterium]
MEKKLYLVKDKKERIFGPYTEEEICFYLEERELKGNEFFSNYPTGTWKALSTHPVFYKKIISQLNRFGKKRDSHENLESSFSNSSEDSKPLEPTRILKVKTDKKAFQKKRVKLTKEFRDEILSEQFNEVIEMQKKNQNNSFLVNFFKVLIVVLLLGVLVFALPSKKNQGFTEVQLLAPSQKNHVLSEALFKEKFKDALLLFNNSFVGDYLKAQKHYVEILSARPSEPLVSMFLCLTHLELWPFSRQSTKDRQALKEVLNLVQKENLNKNYIKLCLVVNSYIERRFEEVISLSNRSLNNQDQEFSPVFFFYLKARALKALGLKKQSLSFLNSIFALEKKWIAPFLLKADIYYEDVQYKLAAQEYQKVLSLSPKHPVALIRFGILNYKYFEKKALGQKILEEVFSSSVQGMDPRTLFEAYVLLANTYLDKGNKESAKKYSHKAYALFPKSIEIAKLKRRLKGEDVFKDIKIEGKALIYKGDLLFNEGKYFQALEEYESSYKLSPSGLAALRSAECYWTLGFTNQAIRWLKKSISTAPHLLDSYFLLADYLSQLYDYENAKEVLNSVSKKNPNGLELFKAYANLAFRQGFHKQSLAYGKKALKFSPFEREIYVLLSRSYLALEDMSRAYFYAKKALDQNESDISAQISYALTLDYAGDLYNTETYFRKLIKEFPDISEYSQALGEYFFRREELEKSEKEFQFLISQNPKFKSAYVFLGRIYSQRAVKNKNYYDEAIKQFREASLLDLSDIRLLFYIGKLHFDKGNYDLAYSEFYKILKINSNYPLVHYYLALAILYQEGRDSLNKALDLASIEIEKNPSNYLAYQLTGDIYKLKSKQAFENSHEKQKMYDLCINEYQKALKHVKRSIEISMSLLECYKGAGRIDNALQLAVSLTKEKGLSGYPAVYREIGSLYEIKEEYELANSYYQIYFRLSPSAKDRGPIEKRITHLIAQKKDLTKEKTSEDLKTLDSL